MLFVFCINDLPNNILSDVLLFSDDTKVFIISQPPVEDEEDVLQRDLNRLQAWSKKWLLKFHPDKCKRLAISRNQYDGRVTPLKLAASSEVYNSVEIESVTCKKDQGIIVDKSLKFSRHIDSVVKKANKIMGLIRRTFDYLDINTFRALFTTIGTNDVKGLYLSILSI